MNSVTDNFTRAIGNRRGADKELLDRRLVTAQANLETGDIREALVCFFDLSYTPSQRKQLQDKIVEVAIDAALFNIEERYSAPLEILGLQVRDIRKDENGLALFRRSTGNELLTCKNDATIAANTFYKNITFDLLVYQARNMFPKTNTGRRKLLGGRGYNVFTTQHSQMFPQKTFSDEEHDLLLSIILTKPHVIEHIDRSYAKLDEELTEEEVFTAMRVQLVQHLCSKIREGQITLGTARKRNLASS